MRKYYYDIEDPAPPSMYIIMRKDSAYPDLGFLPCAWQPEYEDKDGTKDGGYLVDADEQSTEMPSELYTLEEAREFIARDTLYRTANGLDSQRNRSYSYNVFAVAMPLAT